MCHYNRSTDAANSAVHYGDYLYLTHKDWLFRICALPVQPQSLDLMNVFSRSTCHHRIRHRSGVLHQARLKTLSPFLRFPYAYTTGLARFYWERNLGCEFPANFTQLWNKRALTSCIDHRLSRRLGQTISLIRNCRPRRSGPHSFLRPSCYRIR